MNSLFSPRESRRFGSCAGIVLILCLAAARVGFNQSDGPAPSSADYASRKAQAERFHAEGSFEKANEIYRAIDSAAIPLDEARWVAFRIADTQWRSQAATQTADPTLFEQAREQLEAMARDVESGGRTRIQAEIQESLGDFFWTRTRHGNWWQARDHYLRALDVWTAGIDPGTARARYLGIVWKMTSRAGGGLHDIGHSQIPIEVLDHALRIAESANDKARANYLIAKSLRHVQGDWGRLARVPEAFEAALSAGKSTEWHDDALYHYGEWLTVRGRVVPLPDGDAREEPDYVKALELFRRLVDEFQEGETQYRDRAQSQIEQITTPRLGVTVPNIFLPESEVEYHLQWRNVREIELEIYPVELNRDIQFAASQPRGEWLRSIDTGRIERLDSWGHDPAGAIPARVRFEPRGGREEDQGSGEGGSSESPDYKPGGAVLRLDKKLSPGAYLLLARAGDLEARELILVSDALVVLKTSHRQALVYFCNALDGSPITNATVMVWERRSNGTWLAPQSKQTGGDGLALFDLAKIHNSTAELFVTAVAGDRQAFSPGEGSWLAREAGLSRVYAFTDRPVYRPEETVHWKFTARQYDGPDTTTPAGQVVAFSITDPRGAIVRADKVTLNAFGSAWGSIDLTREMALGEYRVTFYDDPHRRPIGTATLFRIEEYKLPEFRVTIEPGAQAVEETAPGAVRAFRPGETVEVTIRADYYFGAPVPDARVEVVVHQGRFRSTWRKPREHSWLYSDMSDTGSWPGHWYGYRQVIRREVLQTGASGRATLRFDTPAGVDHDLEYTIEARVTDASRREIVAQGTVRVTRQPYYMHVEPDGRIFLPEAMARIEFKSLDASQRPVPAAGTVRVTREHWREVWVAPGGREVADGELARLKEGHSSWPPPGHPEEGEWRLSSEGYVQEEILARPLNTHAEGAAELAFVPEREGFYRVTWTGSEPGGNLAQPAPDAVTAETMIWVGTEASTDLGYRSEEVEVIVDKETFRAGDRASVLITTRTRGRYVLFSIEAEDLHSYRLVPVVGTATRLEIPIEEDHAPNIFLNAALVVDGRIERDTKQVVLPPEKHVLTVEVTPGRAEYRPRETGTFVVTTKNHLGNPVRAEVALSVADESLHSVQGDYAGDPLRFYFGEKRRPRILNASTLNQRSYANLTGTEPGRWINEWRLHPAFDSDMRRRDLMESSAQEAVARAQPAPAPDAQPFPAEPAVQVRVDFRAAILWRPDVITGEDGRAVVDVTYPDALTGWRATARAATPGSQFGMATAFTRTKKPLIVSLQAPRFFVVGDLVTISAVIHNNTEAAIVVTPDVEAGGALAGTLIAPAASLTVPAHGQARADWALSIFKAGDVTLKVSASGGGHSDAMEKSFTAWEHGIDKFLSRSGVFREREIAIQFGLPPERRAGSTELTARITSSMAVTMLDALPYLIDYPYGCTEQTLSRFLPAAITAKTLRDLGLQPADVMGRVFGGIEEREGGMPASSGGGRDGKLDELDAVVAAGLKRLYDFQEGDGGWSWWKGGGGDHGMTAYVVWGLSMARDAGVAVRPEVLGRGFDFLNRKLVQEEENHDMQAWMLHAMSAAAKTAHGGARHPTAFETSAFANLWENRVRLNAYTRALLALTAHRWNRTNEARILIGNIENGVKRGADFPALPGESTTAHWGEDGIHWRWSEGGVEATAFALRALLAIDPANELIAPVTNWLLKNRRGAQWSNTRDTAIVVLALNDYLRVSGELNADVDYEMILNGTPVASGRIAGADVFKAPVRFDIDPDLIRDSNELIIRRTQGGGALYFAIEARFFSLEEPVAAAGNEIFVKRDYYRLASQPAPRAEQVLARERLLDGETLRSGERVEVVITIDARNHYEYLLFEDLKPAGFEPVQILSGEPIDARELKSGQTTGVAGRSIPPASSFTGRSRRVHQELRDRKVALFLDKLPEGLWEIRYEMRAESPGRFHALPVVGHAMYVPEIRCNSAEARIEIKELREDEGIFR